MKNLSDLYRKKSNIEQFLDKQEEVKAQSEQYRNWLLNDVDHQERREKGTSVINGTIKPEVLCPGKDYSQFMKHWNRYLNNVEIAKTNVRNDEKCEVVSQQHFTALNNIKEFIKHKWIALFRRLFWTVSHILLILGGLVAISQAFIDTMFISDCLLYGTKIAIWFSILTIICLIEMGINIIKASVVKDIDGSHFYNFAMTCNHFEFVGYHLFVSVVMFLNASQMSKTNQKIVNPSADKISLNNLDIQRKPQKNNNKLKDKFLKKFKCVACRSALKPHLKIYACSRDHYHCSICSLSLKACPDCKESFLANKPSRRRSAEKHLKDYLGQ